MISGCRGVYEYNVEYTGNDIDCPRKNSPEECQEFCRTFPNCVGWEWGYKGDQCCAKTELSNRVENKPGRVAGVRNACVPKGIFSWEPAL